MALTAAELLQIHRVGEFKVASIYVMTMDWTSCKIGYAKNVKLRRDELQVGSPIPVTIYWAARLFHADAISLEKECHKSLKNQKKHIRGEWFKLHPYLAVDAVKRIADELGYEFVVEISLNINDQ